MYLSFTASAQYSAPWSDVAPLPSPALGRLPLLIFGEDTPLIGSLQAWLQEAFPASPLLRTTWIDDALDRMARTPAPLVFLSATLPEGQVFACARTIKARWPTTRTILVAERRLTLSELPQAVAIDACLVAPVTEAQLRQTLDAMLD